MPTFNTLQEIYRMTTPADLTGKIRNSLGTSSNSSLDDIIKALLNRTALGAKDFKSIKKYLENLTSKSSQADLAQLNDVLTILSTEGTIEKLERAHLEAQPTKPNTSPVFVNNLKQVIGPGFLFDEDNQSAAIISSRSPFIHPSKISTNDVELFLNSMPPLVASQMVPYLELEFQVRRQAGDKIAAPGTLKFLLGAVNKNSLSPQDKAQLDARSLDGGDGKTELSFAGMEMFTSPQTLVNMNSLSEQGGVRYVDVIDPFRPFASLESFEVSVVPAVGTYTYKTAKATMKIHDRSRLTEFSDLIRPKGYTDVTIWATYGWLAPDIQGNEYCTYINKNMLVRECYSIRNSSFSFDQVGQITVNLDLYTKGVKEAKVALITDSPNIAVIEDLRKIGEEITDYRNKTLKTKPEGFGQDLRIYQLLDSAQAGEFPDWTSTEINTTINRLKVAFSKSPIPDKANVDKLAKLLKELYSNKNGKFDFKSKIDNTVTALVKKKFEECLHGLDPFLPTQAKATKGLVDGELLKEISRYNNQRAAPSVKEFQRKAVSFGKLFSTFVIPAILSTRTVNEVQVYFYAMNEQCGPVSLHSISEFPIDMPVFMDQYRAHVTALGGERITIEEFLQLIISSQFLDNRAIGYGLNNFYEPYNKNDHDAKVKSNFEKEFENRLAAQMVKYGGFKLPNIEMYIEVLNRDNNDTPTETNLYKNLNTSAKDVQQLRAADVQNPNKAYTIMRVHLYDKQLNPYKEISNLFRFGQNGTSFAEINKSKIQSEIVERRYNQSNLSQDQFISKFIQPKSSNNIDGYTLVGNSSSKLARDALLSTVPKITFGANGTTILQANLSSKADELLSTVNQLKTNRVQNTIAPNGSGDYGLPVRVVPATLNLTTLGCPLAAMAQCLFFDGGTGTTLDNLFIVTGLSHTFQSGKFETNWTLGYADCYGKYEGAANLSELYKELVTDL